MGTVQIHTMCIYYYSLLVFVLLVTLLSSLPLCLVCVHAMPSAVGGGGGGGTLEAFSFGLFLHTLWLHTLFAFCILHTALVLQFLHSTITDTATPSLQHETGIPPPCCLPACLCPLTLCPSTYLLPLFLIEPAYLPARPSTFQVGMGRNYSLAPSPFFSSLYV